MKSEVFCFETPFEHSPKVSTLLFDTVFSDFNV